MKLFLASSIHQSGKSIAQSLGKKHGKRILFVSTASEMHKDAWWNRADTKKLRLLGYKIEEYTFTGKTSAQIKEKLSQTDILCVGGGNTYYLLEAIKKAKALKVIQQAVKKGMIYVGASAGAVVATKSIENVGDFDDKSEAPSLKSYDALNLIDLCLFVHWGSPDLEKDGSQTLKIIKKYFKRKEKIVFLRDDQYLEVTDDAYKIVSAKK